MTRDSVTTGTPPGDTGEHGDDLPLSLAGTAPGIELHDLSQRPSRKGSVQVVCIDYCPERHERREVVDVAAFIATHRPDWSRARWIHIAGLSDMEVIHAIAAKYDLHPLAIEDVLTRQRPKVDDYPGLQGHHGRLFVVAWMVRPRDGRLGHEQISFFLGHNTLITFEHRPTGFFDPIQQRIATEGSRLRRSDVSFLFYALLDAMVDHFYPLLEQYADQLEDLEEVVLGNPGPEVIDQIHRTKRELIFLRRSAWGMRELIHQLQREPFECLSDMTRTYFRDVYDHVIQLVELIETYREFVTGLGDTYRSVVSNRMNEIMKTLTIISTIFVPLTFLAGVYGMNMPIPENHSSLMYPLFWSFCLVMVASMLAWFRYRRWF
jgi:magnesium transporter